MNDLVMKFKELDFIRDQVLAKIDKVHRIMYAQDINLLTPSIEQYRVKYLAQLHRHRKIIEDQQSRILDQIDIKEVLSVMYQD